MPTIVRPGVKIPINIPIPPDIQRQASKIIIIDSDGVENDVTDYVPGYNLSRIATVGLSSFTVRIDNNEGRYVGKFVSGNKVDIYYDFKEKSGLTTRRFRGYIDNIFNSFDGSSGFELHIEGRDAPKGPTNEHFRDTNITIQFTGKNMLDAWGGESGTKDIDGNYPLGILHNSGIGLKVYDTSSSSWKTYNDLTDVEKTTLKALSDYTATYTRTHVDVNRLTVSKTMATDGDYDFRIEYDEDNDRSWLMVHPEEGITNSSEHITAGQTLISMQRFGKDTTQEFNRIKEKGVSDGNILLFRTKQDTTSQSNLWIKDFNESDNALNTDADLVAKADARLIEKSDVPEKGNVQTIMFPTLQPGEKIPLNLPHVINQDILVKSFTVVMVGGDVSFVLDIKERETRFDKLFKDRIDENFNITPLDNPNGLSDAFVFDFSDSDDYNLSNCEINGNVLSLESGEDSGTCILPLITMDQNISSAELRINAGNSWDSTYDVTIGGVTQTLTTSDLLDISGVGKTASVKIYLVRSAAGDSPSYNKVNILLK